MGINDDKLKTCIVTSNASCTTNAGSPLMAILDESIGVEKALLNTVHGYTASQSLVDSPSKKDFRKGRAAAMNIIPSSTGAAIATTKVLPQLVDKFDGIALRVPVIVGSIADITFIAKKDTTVKEVNEILKNAAQEDRWKGIFSVTEDPIVSHDILGNTHAATADLSFTRVVGGNLVKVLSWYDNEMGYTGALVEHVARAGKNIEK
jgi:glyceraldehyde 3-phosphate dehydrogenase